MLPSWRSLPAAGKRLLWAALLGGMCVPLPYVLCPAWDVTVLDEHQRPLPAIQVQVHCRHYSVVNFAGAAAQCHEERITDGNGQAVFAEARRSASLAARMLGILNALRTGAQAGLGRHGYVWAAGNGREGSAIEDDRLIDWRGTPRNMRTVIVARPLSHESEERLFRLEFSNSGRAHVEIELRLGEKSCEENTVLSRKALRGEAGWVFSARAQPQDALCYRLQYAAPESLVTDWQRIDAQTPNRNLQIAIPSRVRRIG